MPRRAVALVCVLLLAGAAAVFVPYLTDKRVVPVSTSATPPIFLTPALVEVPGGSAACLDDVALDPDGDIARFRVGTYGAPGAPLELVLSSGGYVERATVAAGYADNTLLSVPVEGPPEDAVGRACIENEGRRRIALYATSEPRTLSRIQVTVDGSPVAADVALAFYEQEQRSVLELFPEALERMTAFRPVGIWLTWPLAFLVMLGVPGLALWSLARAFRQAPEDQPNAATSRSASEIKRG